MRRAEYVYTGVHTQTGLLIAFYTLSLFMSGKDKNSFVGKIISATSEEVSLPNGFKMVLDRVRHPGGAAVVAVNEQRQVCLLKHYRPIAKGWILELPAGMLEPEELPLQTAQRELEEETGVTAAKWCELGAILSSPGVFDEKVHLYLAREITLGQHRREEGELMDIEWVDIAEAMEWARAGKIVDGKTVVGLFRAQSHLI